MTVTRWHDNRKPLNLILVGDLLGLGYNARMVSGRFSRFEQHIERLVEGSFARLFSGHLHPREIAIQLARAMEDNAATNAKDGRYFAPHEYMVALHPTDHDAILSQHPELVYALSAELVELARVGGLHLATAPLVKVVSDESVARHHARVDANQSTPRVDTTKSLETSGLKPETDALSLKASFILDDRRVIQLDRSIVNVGRQHDNHIILDEPTVSRHHAQVRLRFGRFVLYDLDSRGGTEVNGEMVKEAILQTGDVVKLGDATLIYSEENVDGGARHSGDTEVHPPVEPPKL